MVKTSVGLEIVGGTLRIAAVRSFLSRRRLLGTFEIAGFESLPPSERRQRLSSLRQKHRLPGSRVHLVLPPDAGLVRQLELPSEVRDKLADVVGHQMEGLSPWPVDQIYWAYSTSRPAKAARTFSVTIVIIPRATMDARVELFRSAGFPLRGVTMSSGALAAGASLLWEGPSPVIVLGCEEGAVEGVVVAGRSFSAVADAGSDTGAVARAVVKRLLALARVGDPESARLVVHGAMADDVAGEPPATLPMENAPPGAGRRFFGSIAAALAGIAPGAFAPNALPAAMRYRQSQLQMIPTYVLLCLVGATLLAAGLREPYQSRRYASAIVQEIERIAPQVAGVADQEMALLDDERRFQALSAHLAGRDRNLEALSVLANSLPPTDWISSYAYDEGRLTLSGFSEDTSRLQGILESNPLFEDVGFSAPVLSDPSGLGRFTLELGLAAAR